VEEPKTNKEQQQYETIVVRETTLNIRKQSLSLEMALFPFLFPHGHGSYDGIISFNEYLKYKTAALFSPFTLYKPYLLLMYDLHQPLEFIKESSKTCLEKDMKTCKI